MLLGRLSLYRVMLKPLPERKRKREREGPTTLAGSKLLGSLLDSLVTGLEPE